MKIIQTKKNVQLVLRSGPLALKILLCLLILFSMMALVALRWVHNGIQARTQDLLNQSSALEYANQQLKEKTADIGSVQSIQDIAREELGLVDPNVVIIDPQ